jgi:hypothetical protein
MVGRTAVTCYEAEDVTWPLKVRDRHVSDIFNWNIELKVRAALAGEPSGAVLLGPITADPVGLSPTLEAIFTFNVDLPPGAYIYSIRREDTGENWQLAQGTLTVLDSGSV